MGRQLVSLVSNEMFDDVVAQVAGETHRYLIGCDKSLFKQLQK